MRRGGLALNGSDTKSPQRTLENISCHVDKLFVSAAFQELGLITDFKVKDLP